MHKCLVVDDDSEIREGIRDYLQRFGMSVTTASCGAETRQLVQVETFDVIVLDLMLPDDNGLAVCRWVQENHGTPIIMLTAHGDPNSRILGLEVGADDYLPKPFEPRELVARINAVLRRAQKGERHKEDKQRVLSFHGWQFDRLVRQLVSPDGIVVALSSAEYRLLSAFVDHPGRVLSRDRLIDLTRAPGVDVNDRSIDLAVSRLRQKLGDQSRNSNLIKTMRGEGYLFDVKVSD
jgi:two-component system, OmpR family, response regulator